MDKQDNTKKGLYGKFIVSRTDGKSGIGEKHYLCDYFVLDLTHDKFALPSMRAYIQACEKEYPKLAEDLRKKILKMEVSFNCS
jgi:hypothetical protein